MNKRKARRARGKSLAAELAACRGARRAVEVGLRAERLETSALRRELAGYRNQLGDRVRQIFHDERFAEMTLRYAAREVAHELGKALGQGVGARVAAHSPAFANAQRLADTLLHAALMDAYIGAEAVREHHAIEVRVDLPPVTRAIRLMIG